MALIAANPKLGGAALTAVNPEFTAVKPKLTAVNPDDGLGGSTGGAAGASGGGCGICTGGSGARVAICGGVPCIEALSAPEARMAGDVSPPRLDGVC